VELFRNTNIDFLGKKWYFLAFSLVFSVAGICSMLFWHHIPLGVEFRGGTLVYVKFAQTPDLDQIRNDMNRAGLHDPRIQRPRSTRARTPSSMPCRRVTRSPKASKT
jgi:preprotein translocase subunit SecF